MVLNSSFLYMEYIRTDKCLSFYDDEVMAACGGQEQIRWLRKNRMNKAH